MRERAGRGAMSEAGVERRGEDRRDAPGIWERKGGGRVMVYFFIYSFSAMGLIWASPRPGPLIEGGLYKWLLAPTNVTTDCPVMTPADAKGWQVFHEPRINPQAHGISLQHFTREYTGVSFIFPQGRWRMEVYWLVNELI